MLAHFRIGVLPNERLLDAALLPVSAPLRSIHFGGDARRGLAGGDSGNDDQGYRSRFAPYRAPKPVGIIR